MLALLALTLTAAAPSAAAPAAAASRVTALQESAAPVVERWLVLAPVDRGGRIPVSPDQVFLRHLLDPAAAPPRAGEEVVGTAGTATWTAATPGDGGNVAVRRGGWAYAAVEAAEDRVWLAKLAGAARLHLNGEAFTGDVYRYGFGGVPVFLRKGQNHLYIAGARGSFSLEFVPVAQGLVAADWDAISPTGDPTSELALAARLVLNCAPDAIPAVNTLWYEVPLLAVGGQVVQGGFVPLGMRRVEFSARFPQAAAPEVEDAKIIWGLTTAPGPDFSDDPDTVLDGVFRQLKEDSLLATVAEWKRVEAGDRYRRTFRSKIDGSVQSYGVVPAADGDGAGEGLVLSLHGASVECMDQARAYAAKDDFTIVAPTNRRPYGFDWQDWGRTDAYEVLEDALAGSGADADKVHLTGHSMGGHGAWHLAVNDPDRWASVAPSAGWASFDSYGGRPQGALGPVWNGADDASNTMALLANLRGVPVYVLHGEADDNVPPSEGHAMVAALEELGIRHQAHFEPEAGHWWGNRCVDWPGFFAMFRAVTRRTSAQVQGFDWRSAGPQVDARHFWFEALQVIDSGQPFRVRAQVREVDGYLRMEIATENLRAFRVHPEFAVGVREVAVDGHLEWQDLGEGALPAGATFRFYAWEGSPRQQGASGRGGLVGALGGNEERDYWVRLADTALPPAQKTPARSGPFKRAFDNRFVMVYGTAGDDARDAALLARARHDAQQWWYRGNGDCPVVSDVEFLQAEGGALPHKSRCNVILYGNRDSNAAWGALVPEDCPLDAVDGAVTLGDARWEGDDRLALCVYPRKDSDRALVGILAESGLRGARLGDALTYFISGTGYPDYLVTNARVLAEGDAAVDAAGFFDHAWRLTKE